MRALRNAGIKLPGHSFETQLHKEGDVVARKLYAGREVREVVGDFEDLLYATYADVGVDWNAVSSRTTKALRHVERHIARVIMAPIVHAIEINLADITAAWRHDRKPLMSEQAMRMLGNEYGAAIQNYGEFAGENLTFLQASSGLTNAAIHLFTQDVASNADHWGYPILREYTIHQQRQLHDPDIPRRNYDLADDPQKSQIYNTIQRLGYMSLGTNVTILSTLNAAKRHISLWGDISNATEALLNKVEPLSWTAALSSAVNERYMPIPTVDAQPSAECPFEHDSTEITAGHIWRIPQLYDEDLRSQFCPAIVYFAEPQDMRFAGTTAALLRMESTIYVAAESLLAESALTEVCSLG